MNLPIPMIDVESGKVAEEHHLDSEIGDVKIFMV